PDDHWAVTTFNRFRAAFGGDESVLIALEVSEGTALRPEVLALARRVTRAADAVDGVTRAFSLPDVPVIRFVPGMGPALVRPLPEDVRRATPEAIAAWQAEALALPYVEGFLVSADRRALSVVAVLEQIPETA